MKLAFVTGGTGLLGSNLVRTLVARGVKVRALVRTASKGRDLLPEYGVELIEGDLGNVGDFESALEGVDVLFHTAAHFRQSYQGGRHLDALMRVNVEGTRRLVDAGYAAGVRRMIHTSSIAVIAKRPDGGAADETRARDPDTEPDDYYRSKILSDREIDAALDRYPDLRVSLVLPGFMNGPGDAGPTSAGQLLLDFVHRRLPGVIDMTFSYVDVRDVADAMVTAVDRGGRGERYILAGRTLALRDALEILSRLTGIPAPRRRLPDPVLGAFALSSEAWSRLTGAPVLISWQGFTTMRRERGAMRFDSRKAEVQLGARWRPLEETFTDAIAWFAARGQIPATVSTRTVAAT